MNKINSLQSFASNAYLKAGVLVTMGAMSLETMAATTDAITGGVRQGKATAGESLEDIKERAVGGTNGFVEAFQFFLMALGFVIFVMGILDLPKVGKQGSQVTWKDVGIKCGVGAILAGATYFFWSSATV
ncbi:hypothetical protein OHW85_20945, partial [Acinetobacter baumannii]|nr:hypothetical protein [Acinetobacter baumannii]